jgi:spore coat protein U-like protein
MAAGAAAILGVPGLASAQATGTLTVSASVAAFCTVAATPTLAFGAYDPVAANASTALPGTGLISVTCTKNTSTARIDLDNGANFSGTRRMAHGSIVTEFLSYDLLKPDASGSGANCTGTAWGSGVANGYSAVAGDFTSATAAVDFKVCGSVPAGQNVATGSYTDTVGVTVNF